MKKLLTVLLSFMLAVSLIPAPALAEAMEELEMVTQGGGTPAPTTQSVTVQQPAQSQPQSQTEGAMGEDVLPGEGQTGLQPTAPAEQPAEQPALTTQSTPTDAEPTEQTINLSVQNAARDMGVWLYDFGAGWDDNGVLHCMNRYEIRTDSTKVGDWSNTGNIIFTSYKNDASKTVLGTYEVIVNPDHTTLDGLYYLDADSGLRLPLPAGYYSMTFTGVANGEPVTYTTPIGDYDYNYGGLQNRYTVNDDGFIFNNYYGMSGGAFTNTGLGIARTGTTNKYGDEMIPLGKRLDLDLSVATVGQLSTTTVASSCTLYMYKAVDSNNSPLTIEALRQQFATNSTGGWPNPNWWSDDHVFNGTEYIVWNRISDTNGVNSTTYGFTPSADNNRTGTLSIRNIDLSLQYGTNPALVEGVYFPVVKMKVGQNTYRFAYNPIEVGYLNEDRQAPTITTTQDVMGSGMRGSAYSMTLAGRTGAAAGAEAGTFSWAVTSGALPRGLSLDPTTGVISGTLAADAATQTFVVTLTETIDGVPMSATKELTITVRDNVTLGAITYDTGTIWLDGANKDLSITVPISADLRNSLNNLQGSKVNYVVVQTDNTGLSHRWGGTVNAIDKMSQDGKTLNFTVPIQYDTTTVDRIEVNLDLYDNVGERVLGSDGTSGATVSAAVDHPDVSLGSYLGFPAITYEGDAMNWPVYNGRVRIWPYTGSSTMPSTDSAGFQEYEIDTHGGCTFELEPGRYAFTVEGDARISGSGQQVWKDIAGSVAETYALKGTYPVQHVISVGPNEGVHAVPRMVNMTFSDAALDYYLVQPKFAGEQAGTTVDRDVDFQATWFRKVNGEYVEVATGARVVLESDDQHPLYVEVTPTGRDNAFWSTSGKVEVTDGQYLQSVTVPRRPHFTGTFKLSCASGKAPAAGESWGVIEVRSPAGDTYADMVQQRYSSRTIWTTSNPVEVSDLTAGSIVTFTPAAGLDGGEVSYTVPDNQTTDFTANLEAPLPKGIISFAGLSFADVRGGTNAFGLDDGATSVKVTRVGEMGGNPTEIDVPFHVYDGTRLMLDPEEFYAGSGNVFAYRFERDPTTYHITVSHRDTAAPARMGFMANDSAVQQTFEVTLSPEKTDHTFDAQTLTSRGYANLELNNQYAKRFELLIYDTTGNLVERDAVRSGASTNTVRTPFLNAGTYTAYAVDENIIASKGTTSYDTIENLQQYTIGEQTGHATSAQFTVQNATTGNLVQIGVPNWGVTSLINQEASSVTADVEYDDKVSIRMHAELAEGVALDDNAYLEISTNQPAGVPGQDVHNTMNPKALSINGKGIALNRWSDLFGPSGASTMAMEDGTLRIMLAEAARTSASCKEFPMDLSLVIPRTNTDSIDARIWLVTGSGDNQTRSLVGTYRKQMQTASLVAPRVAAWRTFWVYGETMSNAFVTIYLDGMRAATTHADARGFYTTEVTLPDGVEDFDEFMLQAKAQRTEGDATSWVDSDSVPVMYSTTYPAVERVTLCYQSEADGPYFSIPSYDRGSVPGIYQSYYRRSLDEEENEEDRAKYFWLVEFANVNSASDMENVKVWVPRSTSVEGVGTTSSLTAATGMIADLAKRETYTGTMVYEALKKNSSHKDGDLFSYVSTPRYFSYPPDDLEVTFDIPYDFFSEGGLLSEENGYGLYASKDDVGLEAVDDYGRFEGFDTVGTADLAAVLDAYAGTGFLYTCTNADANGLSFDNPVGALSLTNSQALAQRLQAQAASGTVDEWLLLGTGATSETEANGLLKVRHQVTTSNTSKAQIDAEVKGVLDGAKSSVTACEGWLNGGTKPSSPVKYRGNDIVFAVSDVAYTEDPSTLLFVQAKDSAGDAHFEMLKKYLIDGTGYHVYEYHVFDKASYKIVVLNEKYGQRQETTYTLPEDVLTGYTGFVGMSGVADPEVDSFDVCKQWDGIWGALADGVSRPPVVGDDATGDVSGASLGGQAQLSTQGAKSWVAKKLFGWLLEYFGKKQLEDPNESKKKTEQEKNEQFKDLDKTIDQASEDSTAGGKRLKNAVDRGLGQGLNACIDIATDPTGLEGMATDAAINAGKKFMPSSKDSTKKGGKKKPTKYKPLTPEEKKIYKAYQVEAWKKAKKLPYSMKKFWGYDPELLKKMANNWEIDCAVWNALRFAQAKGKSDPSGIVYEAVLSNPVEGATVKLYEYNSKAAAAGLQDPANFVDSTVFNLEENPQVTGKDGRYQWFVPTGFWQVRVTKDGYQPVSTGDSDAYGIDATNDLNGDGIDDGHGYWMPVLPVQLDVNVPIKSLEAPVVQTMEADELGVTVTFSKYMLPQTVTAGMFTVDGKAPATVEPVDAEAAGYDANVTLARKFRVTYANDECLYPGTQVAVKVAASDAAKSYADVPMAEGKEATLTVQDKDVITKVTPPEATNRTYNGAAQVGVPVGEGYTLEGTASATDAGTYTATAKLDDRCMWTDGTREDKQLDWEISAATISAAAMDVAPASFTYDGSGKEPGVTVKFNGATLVAGSDFTVAFSNNVNPGTGTVTITGKGNFIGTKSATFQILSPVSPATTMLNGTDWSAVYDPAWYAAKNPDVARWATGADGKVDGNKLLSHFVNNGRKEGRASKETFELASYYNANPDLRRAFGTDWARYYDHYRSSGQRENRTCAGVGQLRGAVTSRDGVDWAPVYDALSYAAKNPDVARWATRSFSSGSVLDDAALLSHFVGNGTKECRSGKEGFDVRSYYNANPDLRAAFGGSADWSRYYKHYATNGARENRKCAGTDELQGTVTKLSGTDWSPVYDRATYGQRNADVASWATRKCGSATVLDDYAMLSHFVNNGRKEGRASKASFELASYYNANADLRRAFGTDWARYYDHYRANGQREGRSCAGVGQLRGAPTTLESVDWAPVYDANYYAERNADVASWARRGFASGSVLDDSALLSHFVNSGTKEARASKSTFDVRAYKGKNADLSRAFGSDWKSYYRHYAKFGVNEHRPCV